MRNVSMAGPGMVLGAAALWGTVGPAQVLADAPIGAAALGGWRLLVGGAVLGAWCAWRSGGRRAFRGLARPEVWPWVLVASVATGVFQAAFLASVDHAGAALATALALGTAPAATGVCARWWLGDRLDMAWAVPTVVSVVGCAILLVPSGGETGLGVGGVLLGVVAGGCYGAYTAAAKRLSAEDVDHAGTAAVTLLVGAIVLLPAMALDLDGLTRPSSVALVAWLGIVATGLGYWLFVRGLHTTRAGTAGVLSLAEPLVAAVIGIAILAERPAPAALTGGALLLAGIAAATILELRRTPTENTGATAHSNSERPRRRGVTAQRVGR